MGYRLKVPPPLPQPRGPLSALVIHALESPPHSFHGVARIEDDPLSGDDLHLALYCCYELHYRGFEGVDSSWEWDPSLLRVRARLEGAFEDALRAECPPCEPSGDIGRHLHDVIAAHDGRSLSRYVERTATLDQVRELALHRSAYQLKEADPHTWAIPRLTGRAKAAMVHIQADEYGGGDVAAMHSTLFADTMRAVGLDDTYGAHIDVLPGTTLATLNLVSMFGLHRRLRGAAVGHLALFEMTSVTPMGRYAAALRRLGVDEAACRFYDVHVEADAVHEVIAATELAGGLLDDEPELASEIDFGARAVMAVEGRFAAAVLDAWEAGVTSLVGERAVRRLAS